MSSAINTYNNIRNFVNKNQDTFKNTPNVKDSNKQSFSNVLGNMADHFQTDVKNIEHSLRELSLGNISPEEVTTQVKAVAIEAEGVMGVIKSTAAAIKETINISV